MLPSANRARPAFERVGCQPRHHPAGADLFAPVEFLRGVSIDPNKTGAGRVGYRSARSPSMRAAADRRGCVRRLAPLNGRVTPQSSFWKLPRPPPPDRRRPLPMENHIILHQAGTGTGGETYMRAG
jgi:hypothetical protein